LAGSDQIWNPNYNYSPYYFLQFVDKNKRNTYAASFGVSNISKEKYDDYSKWLSSIVNLSVREDEAISIVYALSGRDAVHVLDPTLLLAANEWEKIEEKPDGFDDSEEYTLVYFLGLIPENVVDFINELRSNGQKIIYIEGDTVPYDQIKDKKGFSYNPQEFLWLLSHCNLALTDSFHGTVFSIINKKKFYVFDRNIEVNDNNIGSRLRSLLRQLHLENRFCSELIDENETIDFSMCEKIIMDEKAKSISYLKSVVSCYSKQGD
jgi:hypothetical protein